MLDLYISGMSKTFTGLGASPGSGQGTVKVITEREQKSGNFKIEQEDVVVTRRVNPELANHLYECECLIEIEGDMTSHGSIIGRELGLPTVVDCKGLIDAIKPGDSAIVNGSDGEVTLIHSD